MSACAQIYVVWQRNMKSSTLMNIRSFKLQSSGLLGKINYTMRSLAGFLPLQDCYVNSKNL